MDCLLGTNWDTRQKKYLLGSLKKVPPREQELYELSTAYIYAKHEAKLCTKMPKTQANTGLACENNEADTFTETKNNETEIISDELFTLETSKKAPYPQTVNMWRAALDIGFNLSRMKKKKVMYILPLEEFPSFIHDFSFQGETGFFVFLQKFAQAFFKGYEVKLMPGLNIQEEGWKITTRVHKVTGQQQLLVKDLYKYLKKRIPKDAYCILGITWTDLYPSEEWNFVLGEAAAIHRSGTISFGRFEPKLYKDNKVPPLIEEIDAKLIWRMMKVTKKYSVLCDSVFYHILRLASDIYYFIIFFQFFRVNW